MSATITTLALRFADNFAPEKGTIVIHQELIEQNGFVWYGKLGSAVSEKVVRKILSNDEPRVLLIHSGKQDRYWMYIDAIKRELPEKKHIPEYYREYADAFKTWFRAIRIEEAPKNILSQCSVTSSGRLLSEVSKSSMSPFFIITTAR